MEIVNKKEKIIFTEEEARAIVLVHEIMRDIECNAEGNDVVNSALNVADYLVDFIEDNFDDADCVFRQVTINSNSTKEIDILIAINTIK